VANNGAAAVAPNEGFVLLTGDAFYDHVPSSTGVPPIVVGMTAAHHGSAQADNERLGGQGIPWAPGSRQARAAHRAGNANGGVTNAAVDAAMALTAGAVHATVLAETTRAVAAAVAAVHALYAAHGAQITHMAMYQWYASAAAASTLAAMRNADGVLPGLAAVAATQLDPGLIEFMPMESIVARLQQLLVDVRGAPPAVLDEDNLTDLGCFSVDACYWLADAANNAGAATPFAAPHPGTAAQAASNRCVAPKWINLGFANHVATIANTAVTCWNLGAGVAQAALRATVAGAYAVQVGTADARPIIDAMPTNRATMARWAARLAAVGAAARAAGVDPDEVAVAVQAVAQGTYGQASSVRNRPRSGLIAYSYGVKPVSFQHEYLSPNVGGLGHGHPRAVALYKAKGWDQRFNASARAGHANVQGDPASPAGNAALRWDNATHMPRPGMYPGGVAAAPYPYACPTCGNALNFNV
jgi:phenylpyruvate tautomerase PptA (4-oxalocrotonate tautomerase family)